MLNQVLKMPSGICQQFAKDAVKIRNILDFQLSQGSVATYCRWGRNLCDIYIENFTTNQLVKEFWKSVHICQSYYRTSMGLLFETWCTFITDFASADFLAVILSPSRRVYPRSCRPSIVCVMSSDWTSMIEMWPFSVATARWLPSGL